MSRMLKKRSPKAGLPPGTLVHIGPPRTAKVEVRAIDYDARSVHETRPGSPEDCAAFAGTSTVTWINVTGVHEVDLLERIGRAFDIHPLILEDIADTGQRPKLEQAGEKLFIVLKMLYLDPERREIIAEQISLVVGPRYVLTFQEAPADVFEPIRQRIRSAAGRIRQAGADYLAYCLMDAVVDNYFIVLEELSASLEELQERLVGDPGSEALRQIQRFRRESAFLRRCAWPLRELTSALRHADSPLIQEDTGVYLQDLHDHAVQVIETVELFRDAGAGMLETYLSVASNRMNEVMKVLTVIATVFIPLTFIAGIYGMNFQHMPELHWRWAYPAVLGCMFALAVAMLCWFWRKRWL